MAEKDREHTSRIGYDALAEAARPLVEEMYDIAAKQVQREFEPILARIEALERRIDALTGEIDTAARNVHGESCWGQPLMRGACERRSTWLAERGSLLLHQSRNQQR